MDYWVVAVDDEAMCLTNVRQILSSAGMKVSCLRSGQDLLKFIEKNTPDLILLDLNMPGMDGFETFHALRELEDQGMHRHIPVIFLTGDNNAYAERRGLKVGASDFIRKPFNQDVLLGRIRNAIENQKKIESLTEEAMYDKLTGFLNKANGSKRIADLCAAKSGAMLVLDLDNFKLVNDLFGHDMGDKVLEAFAEIVRHNTREEDVISRIGGDEFLGFFENIGAVDAVESLTKRLNESLFEKCKELMGEFFDVPIGISIGAVFVPDHGKDFTELFQNADNCLYRAKQNGKHGFVIHVPDKMESVPEDDLTRELNRVTRLVEERCARGALLLGQEAFTFNYRFILRFMQRYNGCANRLLFSVEEINKEDDCLAEAVNAFGKILQSTLRRSDIIFHNKSNQYYLLLPGLAGDDTHVVVERVMQNWEKTEFADRVRIKHVFSAITFEEKE
jgi:diguanylate cyclase (GGDEF)-like protein